MIKPFASWTVRCSEEYRDLLFGGHVDSRIQQRKAVVDDLMGTTVERVVYHREQSLQTGTESTHLQIIQEEGLHLTTPRIRNTAERNSVHRIRSAAQR